VREPPRVLVAGIAISNPERVVYPDAKLTKLDVARYYELAAPRILPHAAGRALTLVRCPEGLAKPCFYQKHAGRGMPDAIGTVQVREETGAVRPYPVISDVAGLVGLVQMGVLEIHLSGARADDLERPDRVVFDLDPDVSLPFARVVDAALAVREKLASLGLLSWVKTTGGKGLHVVVPLVREHGWDVVHGMARGVAESLAAGDPGAYTVNALKERRRGRIFIDYLRNGRGATAVAPWSTRARPSATVAAPVSWAELARGVDPAAFTVATAAKRLRARDPWKDLAARPQKLGAKVFRALEIPSPQRAVK
jgi:bifunctional non-homologous end joining protein LigD